MSYPSLSISEHYETADLESRLLLNPEMDSSPMVSRSPNMLEDRHNNNTQRLNPSPPDNSGPIKTSVMGDIEQFQVRKTILQLKLQRIWNSNKPNVLTA